MPGQKTVSEVLKRGNFLIQRFVRHANKGAVAPLAPLWLRYLLQHYTSTVCGLHSSIMSQTKETKRNKLGILLCYII